MAEGHVKRFVVLLGIATGLMWMTGCSSDRTATVSAAAAAPPAAAPARQVAAKTSNPEDFETSGPVVVENQVDVAAQREGVLAKILVDVGTPVHKGQILAQMDDRQLAAQYEATVAKAAAIEQDAQNWETEIKLVETDLARDEQLYKYQLITQQQLEHSRYKLIGAKQQREREVQNTNEARATANALRLELEKTRILSPFEGVVARRYVRVGQKVTANDRLFWVTATSPLNVRFTLPEQMLGKVRLGQELRVTSAAATEAHTAKITFMSPVVDPSSGTIEVQAQVVGAPGDLRPGMTVNVRARNP
jgi:membrane fusion protein (multidrug efflux system)